MPADTQALLANAVREARERISPGSSGKVESEILQLFVDGSGAELAGRGAAARVA
jgi:hypothetical protein